MPSSKGTLQHGIRPDRATALAKELLRQGLDVRMKVTGSSMAPMVESGGTVVLRPARRIRIGDIVFYRTGTGHAVLHRVVRTARSAEGTLMFFTMGDALCTLEGPFPVNAAMGRAVTIEPVGVGQRPLDLSSTAAHAGAYLKAQGLRLRLALVFMKRLGQSLIKNGVRLAD